MADQNQEQEPTEGKSHKAPSVDLESFSTRIIVNSDVQECGDDSDLSRPKRVSSGWIRMFPRRSHQYILRFRRRIYCATWIFAFIQMMILIILSLVYSRITSTIPKSFAWKILLGMIGIETEYDLTDCMKNYKQRKFFSSSNTTTISSSITTGIGSTESPDNFTNINQINPYHESAQLFTCSLFEKENFCSLNHGPSSLYIIIMLTLVPIVFLLPIFIFFRKTRVLLMKILTVLLAVEELSFFVFIIYCSNELFFGNKGLKKTMQMQLDLNTPLSISQWWIVSQRELKCCGVLNLRDWKAYGQILPRSCCDPAAHITDCEPINAYTNGCYVEESEMLILYSGLIIFILLIGLVSNPPLYALLNAIDDISKPLSKKKHTKMLIENIGFEAYGCFYVAEVQMMNGQERNKNIVSLRIQDFKSDIDTVVDFKTDHRFEVIVLRKKERIGRALIHMLSIKNERNPKTNFIVEFNANEGIVSILFS